MKELAQASTQLLLFGLLVLQANVQVAHHLEDLVFRVAPERAAAR